MKSKFCLLAVVALSAGMRLDGRGAGGPSAVAKLEPTKGNSAAGTVKFEERGAKVKGIGHHHGPQARSGTRFPCA